MASGEVRKVAYAFVNMELALQVAGGPSITISTGFMAVDYNDKVDRSKMRGPGQFPEDATDGEYDADGSVEFHRYQYNSLIKQLSDAGFGFYNVEFDMTVSYAHKGEPLHVDTITRCMFGSRKHSAKQGNDPLTVPCDLFIKDRIYFDNIGPNGETLGSAA